MKTKAAIAYAEEDIFRLEDVVISEPRADEILVRVVGVGLCHTDLVFRHAGAEAFPLPAVFGHEGSGIVESVGTDITKVKPGDRVLMTFRSCGKCDRCDAGDAAYCRTMPLLNYTGRRTDGTSALSNTTGEVSSNFFGQSSFTTHAITYERNVIRVEDDSLPLEILGPLGCGIQTGVGSVLRSLNAQPGQSLLIAGGGSVGLSAVMGATIRKCSPIIIIEPMESRRQLATELGATHTIDPTSTDDLATAIREISPMGVDFALDTSGVPLVQEACLAVLASKGELGLVGVSPPGTPLPGELNTVMTFGQSIRGIIEGDSDPDEFIPELLRYFKEGKLPFDRLVKTYKLNDINEAVAAQHAGECVKAVLLTDAN